MNPLIGRLVLGGGAVLLALLEGNGAVYFFNQVPAKWLCDYGEQPDPDLFSPYAQRIKSYPWKYLFSMAFVLLNLKLLTEEWGFAFASSLAAFVLLELSLADLKYRVVPDQFLLLMAVTAIGFIPYTVSPREALLGALLGFGLMGGIALLGKVAYRRMTLGGGDIKLMTIIGLITGPAGALAVFSLSSLTAALHFVILIARKKCKATDTRPLVPYIGAAMVLYLVFFRYAVYFFG